MTKISNEQTVAIRASNLQPETRKAALVRLQQRIRACRFCQEQGYIPKAQPIVSGRSADAIMVIGQAPGHRSVEQDRPFSGPGGRVLQKWLEQAGFPPGYLHEHTYLTSLTHCDPGKNPRGDGDRRPSPQEVALCRPWLEAEIQLVQPQIILLVGTMAIEAFFGKVRLEDVIGTYQERERTFLLPLAHPSGVSRWLNDPEHQNCTCGRCKFSRIGASGWLYNKDASSSEYFDDRSIRWTKHLYFFSSGLASLCM